MATWYARTDGGTSTQCTGHADAPYPGSGTGQACAYAALQDAINAAAYGDTINARAGDSWDKITLPAKVGTPSYITVQSNAASSIPEKLHGVTNADAPYMAKIATTLDAYAVQIPAGREHWKFIGFEITTANRSQYYQILVDHQGANVDFDRCWIHSLEDYTDNPEASCRIGFNYSGSNSRIDSCRIAYFSAYVLGTTIVDNNFALIYEGSTLTVDNSFLGAWFDTMISGGSSFTPDHTATISGSPTTTGATLSNVTGLAVNDLIALRNYPQRTLINACSFTASTRTLVCTGGNFNAAYKDLGGAGTPRFSFPNLGVGTGVESVVNSTTLIMESNLGGLDFINQTVNIDGVYGAARVSGISGNNVTYAPYGITALQAAPEVPGDVQWGPGFVPNNLAVSKTMWYNNPTIAATVKATTGQNPKAFWEVKAIDGFTVNGCEFTGTGTNLAFLVANQGTPNGCPSVWTAINNVTFTNNYYHTEANSFQILGLTLINNYYCTSEGGGNITVANNLFTSGGVLSRLNAGTNVVFSHNTVINDDGGSQLIQQEASDASGNTIGFNYSDNIAYNNFYGLHCTYNGTLGCFPSSVIGTNLFIGSYTTDPWCAHGFPAGNICVADQASVKFVNAAANDYRLAASSPGKRTGSGGSDMGVNWAGLVAALGYDPAGVNSAVSLGGNVVISGPVVIGAQ